MDLRANSQMTSPFGVYASLKRFILMQIITLNQRLLTAVA
ncbi:elongation factor P [Roseovarius sp. 217]|jgi:hypothetical protein|nr:elongation factor P [Roseovarius sp. 217]